MPDVIAELESLVNELPDNPIEAGLRQDDYTRKSQELAVRAKELEQKELALAEKERITTVDLNKLRERASIEVTDDDLYTAEGIAKLTRKEMAAARLEELAPQLEREQAKAAERAREDEEVASLQQRVSTFSAKNPDFEKYREDIIKYIERPDLDIYDPIVAYYAVKAEKTEAEAARLRIEVGEKKAARREAAQSIGLGSSSNIGSQGIPRDMNFWESYEYFSKQKKR